MEDIYLFCLIGLTSLVPLEGSDCKSTEKSSDWSLLSYREAFLFFPSGSGLFQGDAAPNHRAQELTEWFDADENNVYHMLWHNHHHLLSHSSDLNLTEHLRESLEWYMRHHHHQNTSWENIFWKNGVQVLQYSSRDLWYLCQGAKKLFWWIVVT